MDHSQPLTSPLLTPDQLDNMLKPRLPQPSNEPPSDLLHRYRRVILIISIPLLLVCFVLLPTPSARSLSDEVFPSIRKFLPKYASSISSSRSYAVIFDAGNSGTRVYVFCFDQSLALVHIGEQVEFIFQLKPGLNAYAKDPKAGADSLVPILERAENVVPKDMRQNTPVKVRVTTGLEESERILRAVKNMLKVKSSYKSDNNSVTLLDGTQEGAYQWVTINYLLKRLGKKYSDTVGVVDLGGASVQMAYAISKAAAAKAPRVSNGKDSYVKDMFLMGTKYYLYVHSYLHYGLLAARAKILGISQDSANPCVLSDYNGVYFYGGKEYKVLSPPSGSNMNKCREEILKALKFNKSSCPHEKCTFNGVWNGGGGNGQKNLFVASFFFDKAAEAGFIDGSKPSAKVRPVDFQEAAVHACATKLQDAKSRYHDVYSYNLPYLCMDLVYQYTLLVDGFALDPWQEITLVKKVEYQNSLFEATWPLGSAIEAVSASS